MAMAQSISPSVIASSGGSGTVGGVTVDWTVGEVAVTTLDNGTNILTQGFHQGDPVKVKLNIRAFLQGPYNAVSGVMNDGLRSNGLVPLTEPYTAMGYTFVNGGGETTTATALSVTGNNAIIDWVVVELRDKNDNTNVLSSRSALVQADGDVVDVDGTSAIGFPIASDEFHLAVLHRNHLAVLTFATVALGSSPTAVDLTNGSTATYGTNAQRNESGTLLLWAGDVTGDAIVRYTGANNDRDPILSLVGGVTPTATVAGYHGQDVNMDGTVKYTGAGNDRDPVLQTIGGVVPTNTRAAQLP